MFNDHVFVLFSIFHNEISQELGYQVLLSLFRCICFCPQPFQVCVCVCAGGAKTFRAAPPRGTVRELTPSSTVLQR